MRLLLPVHHFPPHYSAGAEHYTLRLAHAMQARGHEVAVVAIEEIDAGAVDRVESQYDSYQEVPVWRLHFNLVDARERLRWNFDNPLLENWFANHLANHRPDLVHFQAGYLMGVAPLRAVHRAGVPIVLTLHDYWYLCPRHTLLRSDGTVCAEIPADAAGCALCLARANAAMSLTGRMALRTGSDLLMRVHERASLGEGRIIQDERRRALAEALTWPAAVHAPTHFMASRFAGRVPPDRLHVIPGGIEPAPTLPAPRTSHGPLHIGYTGQLAEHKGVHHLVQAVNQLPPTARPVELHIHGFGTPQAEETLRNMAAGHPNIHFHGRYTHADRWQILAKLDLCAVPSIWYENVGFVTLEALAAGVPVLVSKTGGVYEAVEEGVQGLYVQPGSAASLCTQVARVANDPALLDRLRAGARNTPVRTVTQEMDEIEQLYERVLVSENRLPA